jgi:hypothetical protein
MDQGQRDVALRATEVPMLEPEIARQIRGLAAMSWGSKRIAVTLGISRGAVRRRDSKAPSAIQPSASAGVRRRGSKHPVVAQTDHDRQFAGRGSGPLRRCCLSTSGHERARTGRCLGFLPKEIGNRTYVESTMSKVRSEFLRTWRRFEVER